MIAQILKWRLRCKIARRLRQAFIARYCGCTWVSLPDSADIAGLETEVIKIAPSEMIAWNGRGIEAYDEPVALVDALIKELQISPVERAALSRQRDRHVGGTAAVRTALPEISGAGELPHFPEGPFRFFALDVETANNDRGSICRVGVACVRPDDSIETWMTLVDPETETWRFSYLHGIDNAMVQGAPRISAVIDALDGVLEGHTVYQHSGFDRSAIRAACANLGRPEPSWDWKNSVSVANAAWPELKGNGGHGLASLKTHLGLKFEHHDAGEDARAAAEVVLMAERGTQIALKPQSASASDDVLDDGDVAPVGTNGTKFQYGTSHVTASPAFSKRRAKLGSSIRQASGRDTIRVPVAADGTHFSSELARRGYYTVGAKGAEEKYDSFDAALDALNRMCTPRWRRPNAAGNWGIVSGCSWTDIKKE